MLTTHFWLALPNSSEDPEVVGVEEAAEVVVVEAIQPQLLLLHTVLHPDPAEVVVVQESK